MFMMKFSDEAIRNGEFESTVFLLPNNPIESQDMKFIVLECSITKVGIIHPKSSIPIHPEYLNLGYLEFVEFVEGLVKQSYYRGDVFDYSKASPMIKNGSWFANPNFEVVSVQEIIEFVKFLADEASPSVQTPKALNDTSNTLKIELKGLELELKLKSIEALQFEIELDQRASDIKDRELKLEFKRHPLERAMLVDSQIMARELHAKIAEQLQNVQEHIRVIHLKVEDLNVELNYFTAGRGEQSPVNPVLEAADKMSESEFRVLTQKIRTAQDELCTKTIEFEIYKKDSQKRIHELLQQAVKVKSSFLNVRPDPVDEAARVNLLYGLYDLVDAHQRTFAD